MWTEDSEPKDVGAKVYPRYLGISEKLWGAAGTKELPSEKARELDFSSHEAARRHCTETGPLRREFGFTCGKFALVVNGRSKTWLGARVKTNIDLYDAAYAPERALDGDEESYFWGIAPKFQDFFEVSWVGTHRSKDAGTEHTEGARWFRRIIAKTGAPDRPGDQLDAGNILVHQYVNEGSQWRLKWVDVGSFSEGNCVAEGPEIAEGPIVGVKILVSRAQTKWMALTELTAEASDPKDHPTKEEMDESSSDAGWHPHSKKTFDKRHTGAKHLPKHGKHEKDSSGSHWWSR